MKTVENALEKPSPSFVRLRSRMKRLGKNMWRARFVYLLILPVVVYFLIFHYWPLYWLRISFYDFSIFKGFEQSEFVGLQKFIEFFTYRKFGDLMKNVLILNFYSILFCFPAPIILAVFLNELKTVKFKKITQTVTYLPHFISTVAFVGLIIAFLSPSTGALAKVMGVFGIDSVYFLGNPKYFRAINVLSGLWQETGWGAIIYLSALSTVDVKLYEAATVDGANRWHRLWDITLPCIKTTILVMLILKIGTLVSVNFEKIYLLQNSVNLSVSEVIQTYVYKKGLLNYDYSLATAAGLFNSVLSLILVGISNFLSKKYQDTGIW